MQPKSFIQISTKHSAIVQSNKAEENITNKFSFNFDRAKMKIKNLPRYILDRLLHPKYL